MRREPRTPGKQQMSEPRHRRCETCAFWCQAMPVIAAATRDAAQRPDLGACQRNPPVVVTGERYSAEWPQTHASRFCGSWAAASLGGGPDDGERSPATIIAFHREAA
jgi:hypothetical protein